MASFDQLKGLFKSQEEKEGERRKKEKEDEERQRKEDKEEVKEVIRSHMASIKEDIKEIKAKQDQIEHQVLESENKMTKKYEDMVNKVGNLELKLKELEDKEIAKEAEGEASGKLNPALQPVGRAWPSIQPPVLTG